MWRIVGTLALWWFRCRNAAEDWLNKSGEAFHQRLATLAGLLFWVTNLAAPQVLTPQDLETLREQWEQRQRAEFWSNVFELLAAAATGWILWLLRTYWVQILKTFWKYLKVSARVPIEIVDMKDRNAVTRQELLDGQREIITRQTLLIARKILEDHGAVASFVTDQHGAWKSVTKEMAEIAGDHPQNLLGFDWKVRVGEDDRERVMASWMKAIKNSEPFSADFYFVSTAGKKRKVRMIAYQQLGPHGTAAGYVGQVFKIPGTGEIPPLPVD